MPAYNSASNNIGTLLRAIQEEKTQSPIAVPPGADPSAPGREAIQVPVLNPESPGTSRSVQVRPEGVSGPGLSPVSKDVARPASIAGGLRIGGDPGNSVEGLRGAIQQLRSSIPAQRSGAVPTATPVEKQSTIPITQSPASPAPKSFIQTPGVALGTKIASTPIPISAPEGQTRAEAIVNFANNELKTIAQVASSRGFDSQEGQAALDRLQKLDAQLSPLAATAPSYLKQNLQTLSSELADLRLNAVLQQTQSFRQIPQWANEAERQEAQGVLDQIAEAERMQADYERRLEEASRSSDSGSQQPGNPPSVEQPRQEAAPTQSRAGQVAGASASAPQIAPRLYPANFIGPIPSNSSRAVDTNNQAANEAGARGDAALRRTITELEKRGDFKTANDLKRLL